MSQVSTEKRKELALARRKRRKAKVREQVKKRTQYLAGRMLQMSSTIKGQQVSLIALQKKNNELEEQLAEVTPFSEKAVVEEVPEA